MTTNTTYPGDRDPQSDPADEWDREVSPAQTLATAMRTAVAAKRDLDVLAETSVYIAGPMTSIPEFNFPAFKAAASDIDEMGVSAVYCTAFGIPPAPEDALPWEEYRREALQLMLTCNAVVVLPGWRESKGARLEVYVALELGMPVVEYPDLRPVESIDADEVHVVKFGGETVARLDASHVTDAEYAASSAEYLDRRYGGNDPRRMFEDTIDLPKDETR